MSEPPEVAPENEAGDAAGRSGAPAAEQRRRKVGAWLSAPLLITVVGAVLAGYLIPRIAAEADNHRKARELQTSLVQDMGQAVAHVSWRPARSTRRRRTEP